MKAMKHLWLACLVSATFYCGTVRATEEGSAPRPTEGAMVPRGYVGVGFAPDEPNRIVDVIDGSPADTAGIKVGDVVLRLNGERVVPELLPAVFAANAGKAIDVTLNRKGQERTLPVQVGKFASMADGTALSDAPSLELATQRLRFGPFADAAGKWFIFKSPSGDLYPVAYRWVYPGLSIEELAYTAGKDWRFDWDAKRQRLNIISLPANYKVRTGKVVDGVLIIESNLLASEVRNFVNPAGRLVKDSGNGELVGYEVSYKEYKALVDAEVERAQELERQKKVAKAERWDRINSAMGAVNGALGAASEVTSAYREQTSAELDATLQSAARQAEYERAAQQQTAASAETQRQAELARQANQGQEEEATRLAEQRRQQKQQRAAAEQAAASSSGVSGRSMGDADSGAGEGAKPLRFVLWIGLEPRHGDTHNPTCYSNVITRPGPPGWGEPGFLPPGSASQANQTIESLKAAFIAKCRATSGRETLSEGNFGSQWNQLQSVEVDNIGARFQEDVNVQMD